MLPQQLAADAADVAEQPRVPMLAQPLVVAVQQAVDVAARAAVRPRVALRAAPQRLVAAAEAKAAVPD
jgi:hypothetical protein